MKSYEMIDLIFEKIDFGGLGFNHLIKEIRLQIILIEIRNRFNIWIMIIDKRDLSKITIYYFKKIYTLSKDI